VDADRDRSLIADDEGRLTWKALSYALIWPAAVVAFALTWSESTAVSPIVLFLALAVIGVVGAVLAVRTARRVRRRAASPRLAAVAETVGWIEIVVTAMAVFTVVLALLAWTGSESV
jgi:hypothetical protein